MPRSRATLSGPPETPSRQPRGGGTSLCKASRNVLSREYVKETSTVDRVNQECQPTRRHANGHPKRWDRSQLNPYRSLLRYGLLPVVRRRAHDRSAEGIATLSNLYIKWEAFVTSYGGMLRDPIPYYTARIGSAKHFGDDNAGGTRGNGCCKTGFSRSWSETRRCVRGKRLSAWRSA